MSSFVHVIKQFSSKAFRISVTNVHRFLLVDYRLAEVKQVFGKEFCYFSFLLGEIRIQIAELSRSGICEWTYLSEPLKKALSCDVNMLSKIGDP